MADKITLPKETEERVSKEIMEHIFKCAEHHSKLGYAKAPQQSQEDAEYIQGVSKYSYITGANNLATLALPLLEALKTLRHGLFKDADAVNEFIDKALMDYKQQP